MSQPSQSTVQLARTNTVKQQSTSAQSNPNPATTATSTDNDFKYPLPSETTFKHASKISITEDRPIMMDYWTASCDKTAFIGVRSSNKEKLLVKSAEEYTSPIAKILQVQSEYIILTENSIYIVSKDLPQKRIS
jgi:hypothetical protein